MPLLQVIWSFANPLLSKNSTEGCIIYAKFLGPLTVANGVVFAPSMDTDGTLFYLDAATGKQLGTFKTGASLNAGASVVGQFVYVGSGYNRSVPYGTPGSNVYGLHVPAT